MFTKCQVRLEEEAAAWIWRMTILSSFCAFVSTVDDAYYCVDDVAVDDDEAQHRKRYRKNKRRRKKKGERGNGDAVSDVCGSATRCCASVNADASKMIVAVDACDCLDDCLCLPVFPLHCRYRHDNCYVLRLTSP